MLMTLNASTSKTETGLQVDAGARGFKVVLDEPADMGGTDTGMNPIEMTLCAFGGCLTILTSMMASKMRLKIEDIKVDVEGDIDLDGVITAADALAVLRFSIGIDDGNLVGKPIIS